MEQKFLIPSAIVVAGAFIAGAVVYSAMPPTVPTSASLPSNTAAVVSLDVVSDDHMLGNPKAPVTVIEYSDFECPFCQRLYADAVAGIKEDFVKSGKVLFVYRHFPLRSIHPSAQKAAEASECAWEQGKFWEYHDMLFERQSAFGVSNFKAWAQELGLNSMQFNECLDSGKFADRVERNFSEGTALGVNGTPATFVNGQLISGALPYASFKQIIEATLSI